MAPKKQNLTLHVLFILDSSTGVTASNFTQEKDFVKSLINQLNIYPADGGSRVGIMVYSDEATMVLDFQNKESKSSLEAIIDNLPQSQGLRRIDNALREAVIALSDVDTDDPKFVILLIAGQQTNEPGAEAFSAAVRPLHRSGTRTHVMAIGDAVNPGYFQEEDQEKANFIFLPQFSDLPQSGNRLAGDLLNDYGRCIIVTRGS